MNRTLLPALLLLAGASLSPAAVTYVFNTGENILSPAWPAVGSTSPNGSTAGVDLGTNLLSLADETGLLQGATLTGSGNLFCVVASNAAQCAANATSDSSSNAGHVSGLGVGNGRMNEGETLTIQVDPGYVATLIGFQVTGMIGPSGAQEFGTYNLGSGPVQFAGGDLAIDTIAVNSGPFTTLTFSVPGDGPNGGNTWALHSLTLTLTPVTTTPEPGTMALLGLGLAGMGVFFRRDDAGRSSGTK